ncbi:phage tail spike protein [Staphylococcus hominis]|uniref:phage tail spike protein n=1 Tax=Staphylococcus hominis TaxID=1290 RepID=UPI000E05D916|nr:phage tail spike protein [Staphylococcus hominis]SUM72719.1 phage minor structural protein [Staphylococcus hominis]
MKNVGIHVLDFNDNIIDFISQSDGALLNVEMSMNVEEKTETFDFTIENTRAEKLRERNRIIAQDNNGTFREFIIIHITDNFDGTTEIECNASYLEDLKTAKPIKSGKFEAHTTTQALLKTLADTGWEVSDDTEYGGNRTTSWTSHTNPFDLIYMLCTTYDMVPSFYIELGAHTVEHRYVSITKPKNLFKGKEITKGKDLTGMTRTIDLSEVKTALLAVGPEKEDGSRIETVVVDDEAQEIFGLPNHYIWDVYEPESNDENMTLKRLTTLAKTELNKRNQAAISYEVSSIDIHKYYNDVTVHLRDIVRVKDRDFRPPLYIEAEVIGIKYNWLADESEFTFGNVIEYEETKLREFFTRKLDEITKKLNDNISNVNTIVSDVVAGELEYYERKIFKGAEPPENPQNDTLWYDTSNPNVAVLRRYWNGEWITQTADDVEKIGGLRREQVMYRDLNNSFINLTIQHSKLQNDVYDVLNSEYLVDDDLKGNLNQALLDVDNVYQEIKINLDGMDEDTATIGKLVDTQTLFTVYREKLQTLYKYVTDAKISIDKRLKLLQSQYTDEKFNDAMDKIAQTLPNGRWDSENQQLYADIPNRNEVESLKTTLQDYTDGQISNLNSILGKEIDSKINTTKNEISASISSVERKVDGIQVGGRNLALKSDVPYSNSSYLIADYMLSKPIEVGKTYTITVKGNVENSNGGLAILRDNGRYFITSNADKISDELYKVTFKANSDTFITDNIRLYNYPIDTRVKSNIEWIKLEEGNISTDWTPAPEDIESDISKASEETQTLAKSYTENALKPITTRIITNETNISELDKQISLMAKSDDVEQKLKGVDGRLTPLETTVKSNKATLDVLPTQIESKVSKQDYTLDKDNIVQRLDNADSERKQLSNEITDKVTLTKFESGMTEAKNYTDNIKKETENYTDNQINNLDVGSENLLLDSEKRNDFSTYPGYVYIKYYLTHPLEIGKTYSVKADIVTTDERQSGKTSILPYNPSGTRDTVDIKDGKITYTFTAKVESTEFLIYKDVAGQSNVDLNVTIEKAILVEGDKVTGWSPANQDIKKDIQQAETNAKNYTDDYKRSNDVAMTKLETSITQNGDKIALKVDEQKFNASRKTLSQVISEISLTTKGINLSYDENGNIQSYTMDKNGIQLRGDKVDINQGDVVIQNGVTTIKDAYIDKLFSKNATIQYLNSIDITAKRLQAIDNKASVNIENGSITMTRADKAKLNLGIDGISMYNSNGSKRFSIDERLVTSAALGTSNANVYLGTGSNYEARIVDVSGLPSDGYVDSYVYRPLRAEGFYGNYWNINTADTLGDPKNLYARPLSGGELRVTLNENTSNYQNVRVDGIFANFINVNGLHGNSRNLYLMPLDNGEVRSTISGQVNNYAPIRAESFYLEGGQIADNSSGNSYIGTNGEWRFTSNQFYNGGNTTYRDIRFGNWHAMSSEKFKYDIKEWNYSVLDAFRNDLKLYSYKLNAEKETKYARNHHGIIIEREIPIEWRHGDGFDGNEVIFWNTKAIQELIKKVDKLEEQLNEQSITS